MSFTITHTPLAQASATTITLDQVDNLYIGKGNNCRCGCAGKYHAAAEEPKLIEKYLAKMASGDYEVESIDSYIFEIVLSKRDRKNDYGQVTSTYKKVATLYLKKTPKA
jgi:hypothetical protein